MAEAFDVQGDHKSCTLVGSVAVTLNDLVLGVKNKEVGSSFETDSPVVYYQLTTTTTSYAFNRCCIDDILSTYPAYGRC